MSAGALLADSIIFLEAAFVSAVALYLGLTRYRPVWALAGLAVGGLLLATGLALVLDVALLGMLALATAALSVLYVAVALYDLFRHTDEYADAVSPDPGPEQQQPEGLQAAAHQAIELLEGGEVREAIHVLREALPGNAS